MLLLFLWLGALAALSLGPFGRRQGAKTALSEPARPTFSDMIASKSEVPFLAINGTADRSLLLLAR